MALKEELPVEAACKVLISGIKGKPHLNGTIGVVMRKDVASGTWLVKVAGYAVPLPLHARTLVVVGSAPAAAAGGGTDAEKAGEKPGASRSSFGKTSMKTCKEKEKGTSGKAGKGKSGKGGARPTSFSSSSASTTTATMTCSNCGGDATEPSQCAGCHQEVYCDGSCQKEHWSVHKAKCRALRKAAAGMSSGDAAALDARLTGLRDGTLGAMPHHLDEERITQLYDELAGTQRDPDDVSKELQALVGARVDDRASSIHGVGQWFNDAGVLVSSNRPPRAQSDTDPAQDNEDADAEFPCPICFGQDTAAADSGMGFDMCYQCGQSNII